MTLPANDDAATEPKFERRWSRFSLRMLFVAVTAVAILLYLLTSAPSFVATPGLYLLDTLLMAFFLAGALYGGENLKAFCRGATLPFAMFYLYLTYISMAFTVEDLLSFDHMNEAFERSAKNFRSITMFFASASLVVGSATLGFKLLLEPRDA